MQCDHLRVRPLVYSEPLATGLFYGVFVLWSLSELQIVLSRRGGHGDVQDRGSKQRLVGLIWLGLAAAFGLAWVPATAMAGDRWVPVVAGVALILAGIALRRWAVVTLGRYFTTSVEILEDHRVVDTGPYSVLRHPAYAGELLSMVGTGAALGNWLSLLATFIFGVAALAQRINVEEAVLTAALGPAYEEYARRRKRVIPWLW
jgi:protein-S-isoprenylcysteine O-methyltransferase